LVYGEGIMKTIWVIIGIAIAIYLLAAWIVADMFGV
jgi:hypothetical protein